MNAVLTESARQASALPSLGRVILHHPGFGAEVRGIKLLELSSSAFEEVLDLYHRYGVLLFRNQHLTPESLIDLGRRFGDLEMPGVNITGEPFIKEHPEVLVVSNLVDEAGRPLGNLGAGATAWHSDMSYRKEPISAAILHAVEVPAQGGGEMLYADMYEAYETLDEELRKQIEGRMLVHDETYNSAGQIRKGFEPVTDPRKAPGARHPIVRTHPVSGRKALYLGRRRNGYIVGLDLAESERVLDALWAFATRFTISWGPWEVGDVLIWDNRCTLHLRTGFDPQDRCILYRVQVKGEKPV